MRGHPPVSARGWYVFAAYSRRYVRSNFHAFRILEADCRRATCDVRSSSI